MQTNITDTFMTANHILTVEIAGTLGGGRWQASIEGANRAGEILFRSEGLRVLPNDRGFLGDDLRDKLRSDGLDGDAVDSIIEAVARLVRTLRRKFYIETQAWIIEVV